jgi:PAS domain-containing protein
MTWTMASLVPAVTFASALAVLLGLHRHRPRARAPWLLIAAGLGMCALPGLVGLTVLIPLYFVGELMLVAAIALLVRHRLERAALIDASIITLCFAAVSWLYLAGPAVGAASANGIPRAVVPVALTADALLVAVGALLGLGAWRQGRAAKLIALGGASLVASHLLYMWSSAHGGHTNGSLEVLAWLSFCLGFAACAQHPSMRLLSEPAERTGAGLTRGRLAIFAITSMLAPAVAIAHALRGEPGNVVISLASGVIFLLVLLRVADLVREHETLAADSLRSDFERRLGSLVNNSSDVVCIVDARGIVTYVSPAALRLVGLDAAEAE